MFDKDSPRDKEIRLKIMDAEEEESIKIEIPLKRKKRREIILNIISTFLKEGLSLNQIDDILETTKNEIKKVAISPKQNEIQND